MDIDPRRLRYLLAVARAGGVLAAADELQMTPSAVSQQIARLERETDRVLMTRTTHGSALTPEGQALAEAALQIEQTLASVQVRLERGDAEIHGTMRLGGFQSFLSVVVAPALAQWKRQLPGVHFQVSELEPDPMMRALKDGDLDAGIVELDAEDSPKRLPSGMVEVPLLDEPWKLVVPAGTLASDVAELGRLTLPWLGMGFSGASARAVARLRRASGMNQPTVHRYFATQTALALVAAGEGMALIPMLALQGAQQDGVETLDVPGLGTRRIVLRSYSRGKQANNLVSAVTVLLHEAVAAATADESAVPA
ncbi:LysR family transcriptional regulator [Mycolicibacterium parafortuitum]|uniref:LysR family transcriptional regulator [Arthrobacter chlorophenolicus A6] n=1 Tax=Mycolicibacterium parafortuitum TaxID=39692 RepID=A0A375YD61_MYCPF|nr:LysR family transcriptional regulator [Mycolicibacterium parafortuitum]ORB31023.1 LysR family transcriptional regulator [Mycolicibacterium parafortuitum]SRX79041.1 LysR family transcriptional regulator [Arthrobacter chlorophenolicus A6] [Mycolicibacterium parafortuitum]